MWINQTLLFVSASNFLKSSYDNAKACPVVEDSINGNLATVVSDGNAGNLNRHIQPDQNSPHTSSNSNNFHQGKVSCTLSPEPILDWTCSATIGIGMGKFVCLFPDTHLNNIIVLFDIFFPQRGK